MSPGQPLTAISPSDPSLAAHLAALDLLAARLSALTDRTRWPARVPLNSKASIVGQVVHTNEMKINVGGGYWIEMTAKEAEEYVKRRKTGEPESLRRWFWSDSEDLLLSHAGLRANPPGSSCRIPQPEAGLPTEISFNPLFDMPAAAGPSKARAETPAITAASGAAVVVTRDPSPITKSAATTKADRKGKGREVSAPAQDASPSPSSANTSQPRTLQDLMDQFLDAQQSLSQESQENIAKLNGSQSADAVCTDIDDKHR